MHASRSEDPMANPNLEEPREKIVTRIGELLGARAGAELVYAKPIERGSTTIVPVARVRFGFGGGGGQKPEQQGAGGGGGLVAEPAGFVVARGDEIRFEPIRDPTRIAFGVAAIAFAASWLVRAVARLRR
jgi:uncharacterized spore protein YtfJ